MLAGISQWVGATKLGGSNAKKIMMSVAVLGASASIAALGTFASFTSTTSASQNVGAGTVSVALGAPGAGNRIDVTASNIVPGDTMQRAFQLTNDGTVDLASIALTTVATASSLLDTDATNGLQMAIDRCSQAWTETGVSPAFVYTCGGSTSTVLASRAVIGSGLALSNLAATTAGSTDYLRLTLTFPVSADNTLQGLSSTVQFSFVAAQRAATNK
ncbi:MAG TPA: TasA family protein [Actinomycetota bacterium]|nr:TasA family protein [Actinomycetota bacterium]